MGTIKRDWILLCPFNRRQHLLSLRERQVIFLIGAGYRAEEMAHKLSCSVPNIRKIETSIRKKLNARTNANAVLLYYTDGQLD